MEPLEKMANTLLDIAKIMVEADKRIEALEKQVSGIIALINVNAQAQAKN